MKQRKIIGLSGFGDAIYIEPLIRRLAEQDKIILYTDYPQVFEHIPNVEAAQYNRGAIVEKTLSYIDSKANTETTQLDDLGYRSPDEFQIAHKKIALVCAGYKGMGTRNEFIPKKQVLCGIIKQLETRGYRVIHIANGTDADYGIERVKSSSYFHTLALFKGADLIVCQQGWATGLAEGLNKPCLVVFAETIASSDCKFIRQVTPKKVCCKKTTSFNWDNEEKLEEAFNEVMRVLCP